MVSPTPRGPTVSSARPPSSRKTGGRKGKDVHSKVIAESCEGVAVQEFLKSACCSHELQGQRGGYRGLALEKSSSQCISSGNGTAKRGRTSTKPVARPMNYTGNVLELCRRREYAFEHYLW